MRFTIIFQYKKNFLTWSNWCIAYSTSDCFIAWVFFQRIFLQYDTSNLIIKSCCPINCKGNWSPWSGEVNCTTVGYIVQPYRSGPGIDNGIVYQTKIQYQLRCSFRSKIYLILCARFYPTDKCATRWDNLVSHVIPV